MTRYENLILVRELPERSRGGKVSLWRCDCGCEKPIPNTRVRSGQAKSCGCLRRKHGGAERARKSPEYVAWSAMHARCRATSGRDAEAYSMRGIGVCARWADFAAFLQDMGAKPSRSHSLGRIDNNVGYQPDNCRWETPAQQQRNTRKSKRWHIKGGTFESSRQAALYFGVDSRTIRYWAQNGTEGSYVSNRY